MLVKLPDHCSHSAANCTPFMFEDIARMCMFAPQVPRPHVSVGWVLSDDCSAVEAAVAKLNVQSAQQLQSPTLTVKVWCPMHVLC